MRPAYSPVAALACAVTYLVSLGIPTHYGVLSTNSVPGLDSPRRSPAR